MKRAFSASIVREDDWYVAQCLEVDVASQGETPDEALHNLEEALALAFDLPQTNVFPVAHGVEEEIGVAAAKGKRGSM